MKACRSRFTAPSPQHSDPHLRLHRPGGIHAFALAGAQLHVRLHLLLRPHDAHLRRLEAGGLATTGAASPRSRATRRELLRKSLRPDQIIYCSPLVDPYQPAEETECLMPRLLDELIARPPRVFAIQTRGPLILRDLAGLAATRRTHRVCASAFPSPRIATTCAGSTSRIARRLPSGSTTVRRLRAGGHRGVRHAGAPAALRSGSARRPGDRRHRSRHHRRSVSRARGEEMRRHHARCGRAHQPSAQGFAEWHDPAFQAAVVEKMRHKAAAAGRRFATGPRRLRLAGGGRTMTAETNDGRTKRFWNDLEIEPVNSGACDGDWIPESLGRRTGVHQSRGWLGDRARAHGRAATITSAW